MVVGREWHDRSVAGAMALERAKRRRRHVPKIDPQRIVPHAHRVL